MNELSRGSTATPIARLSIGMLFFGFLKVGLSGFGGVMPFARRMIVEERRWLTEAEFLDILSLAQFLPGPNIVNVSVIIGRRFRGPAGSVAATAGLMLMPLLIVLVLAAVYTQYAQLQPVRNALLAVSASASGLIVATAIKLSRPIHGSTWQIAICAAVFAAIALGRVSLPWVLLVGCPLSFALAWRTRR